MNLPDLSKLTPAELAKQHAIILLEHAAVGLSLAATCFRVNSRDQMTQYITEAVANVEKAKLIIYGAPQNEPKQESGSNPVPPSATPSV